MISLFDPEVRARISASFDDPADAEARLALLERWFHKYLERGRRFVWSLTVEMARAPWRLVVFGGYCDLTPARLVVHETDAGAGLYLAPGMIAACIAGSGWLSKIGIAGTGQCRAERGSMFGSSNTVRGLCSHARPLRAITVWLAWYRSMRPSPAASAACADAIVTWRDRICRRFLSAYRQALAAMGAALSYPASPTQEAALTRLLALYGAATRLRNGLELYRARDPDGSSRLSADLGAAVRVLSSLAEQEDC